MDDEQTQPDTQQILDPRRVGHNNSGLNSKDTADVLAILHPASPAAIKIVEDSAEYRRQHVLFRNPYDSFDDEFSDIEEQETIIIDRPGVRSSITSRVGADLALRMSSPLTRPGLGFVFGRNPASADIVFTQDSSKRISNQHFRIYMTSDGILMLEDMSTNGTLVDEVLLKNRDKRFNKVRMLGSGSIICIQSNNDMEMIKFIVRVPSRVSHLDRYQENVRAFLTKCATNKEQLKALQRLGNHQFGGSTMKWDGGPHYNIIGLLGKGAFATVHQIATKMEGKVLAAKELEKRRFMKNGQLDKKIDNEMRIMKDLRHPNIVEFVEYHDQGDYLYIIMEFVRHGDLQGYLNQHGSLKEPDAKILARQILSALSYLHRMKITHRDIKPDNILIADTNPLTVKLSDFGLSKVVKHDETFLKTFCGTLLYCAPEVFPEYETTLTKGTKRRRGTKQQFHSYSSSVDVWSFAGVLWYSLCGKPPFEGIADATGQAMYNNIMATRLDPTPLKEAGISASCIDLLTKMLQTDPSLRPTDRECLDHPWLKNGVPLPQDPILQSIVEEDESDMAEEQLSQLSIREEVPESDEELDDDILEDEEFESLVSDRQSKKLRTDPLFPRNQFRDQHNESSADPYFHSEVFPQSHNQVEESFKEMTGNTGRLRLFGEIGQSALQSSGILSAHAKEALSNAGSVGDVVPDDLLADNVPYTGQTDNGSLRRTSVTRKVPQLDGTHSSPSLLGAESMVRELNVESPQSPASGLHSPVEPATPKTPEMHQHNSLEQHSSQFSESTPKAKPSQFSRQISLPKTASFYYNPYDPSTHNLEYASEVSGYDYVGEAAKTSQTHLPDTIRVSTKDESFVHAAGSTNSEAAPNLSIDTDIKAPPRRLGKLVATTDSFVPSLTLMIDNHQTSWGRAPGNTIVYDNAKDTRIPKTAFVIFWYSRNGESDAIKKLSQQGIDWTQLEDLQAGIFTNATSGILINGKHLKKTDGSGQQLYGHLHSGDIVQVYQARQGVECLKFKCEFYRGSGKEPRAATESFQILHATRSSQ